MPVGLRILFSLAACALAVGGIQALRRREIVLRRRWGEIGPKALGTIRGAPAVRWGVWLMVVAVGLLAWIWIS